MAYYYVELDENSYVKATLETPTPMDIPTMIPTDYLRNDLLGWLYKDGQFYPSDEG